MRFMKPRRRNGKKRVTRLIKLFVFILMIAAVAIYMDSMIRPVVKEMAESKASIILTRVVNEVVYDCLAQEEIDYTDIVMLDKDANGDVVAIHSNILKINQLKASITTAIQEELIEHDESYISIPLGNLTGIDFLSGHGPKIKLKFQMSAATNAEISSSLTDAAINQSRHRMMLDVSTDVYIMIPAYNTSTNVSTSYCIAETVIVGDAPSSYAEMPIDMMDGPNILE